MENEKEKNVRLFSKLAGWIPKDHLKLRIILMVLFAVLILGSAVMIMPRTTYFAVGAQGDAAPSIEVTADTPLSQKIAIDRDGEWKGVGIWFHTYGRNNKAEYTVELLDAAGNLLSSNAFDAQLIAEDSVFSVPLPNIPVRSGETYELRLSSAQAEPGNALGVFLDPAGEGYAQLGGTQAEGMLCIELGYASFSNTMMAVAGIMVIAVCLAILFWGKKLHVNTMILVLILGVLFALITPITDTPDEQVHVASTFLLADGQMATISGSEAELRVSYNNIAENHMRTLTNNTLAGVEMSGETRLTTWGTGKLLLGFLPQTVGQWVGRLFQADMMGYFYLGRIFNVLAYAVFAFFAVKIAPKFKLFLSVLALMPMSLIIAGSYNPDGMTYGLGLLLGGLLIDLCFNKSYQIAWKQILAFTLVLALLLFNKFSLAPLCLLLFIVPASRFQNKKTKYLGSLACFAITAIAALAAVWWMTKSSHSTSAMQLAGDAVTSQGANVGAQLSFMLGNPSTAVSIFVRNIMNGIGNDLMQLFTLGQLTYTVYNVVAIVYFAFLAVVGFSYARYEYKKELTIGNTPVSLWSRLLLLLLILGAVVTTYLALYLTWSPVGGGAIQGVQGRYFIPLFVLLPFLGQNVYPLVGRGSYERSQINIQFMAALFSAFTLLVTLKEYY